VISPLVHEYYSIGRLVEQRADTLFFAPNEVRSVYPLAIAGITRLERSTGTEHLYLHGASRGFVMGLGIGAVSGAVLGALMGLAEGSDCAWFCPGVGGSALLLGGFLGVVGGGVGMVTGWLFTTRENWIPVPLGQDHAISWSIHPGLNPAITVRVR
jgi:hypothetical protein